MRCSWLAASVVTLAVLAVPTREASPFARRAPDVTWTPERPTEGELFVVRVVPSDGEQIILIAGTAAEEALHFERTGDGSFESLAAIPVGARVALSMILTVIYADGREEVVEPTVPITPGEYEHRRLTVAPEFGSPPDSAQQARRARDAAKAAEVSGEAHRTPRVWTGDVVLPRDDRITSGFGDGREFNGQISSRHMGLDLDGETGDTVVAAARGIVALVDEFQLAGNVVYLNHGTGLVTGYFHLSEHLVAKGDTVEAGTPIGRVGATGRVTGPHLHWVVRYGLTSVDPRSLMAVSAEVTPPGA